MRSICPLSGVLCSGNISWDILLRPVDEFRWGTSTWVEDLVEQMGGNGSNTAFALATLGVPVRLMGMVGRDARAEALFAKLRGAGVDTSFVGYSGQPTTVTICVTNSGGDRLFLQQAGASNEAFAVASAFEAQLCAGFSHYHCANLFALPRLHDNLAAQMRRARQAGLSTSIDTGWDITGRWMRTLEPALPYTDMLFTNQDEARMLVGDAAPEETGRRLRSHFDGCVVLKLGPAGAMVFSPEGDWRQPGFAVPAVDTTGAGDCFAAGLLAALYRGFEPLEALRCANAMGALTVSKLGATAGVVPFDALMEWIEGREAGAA